MASKPDFKEIGATGLNRFGGYVTEDIHRALRGAAWRKNVTEMTEQDAIIGAMLFAIDMLIRGVEWQVMPAAEDDDTAAEWAGFVEECFEDMSTSWSDTISEILTMLPWGFAPFEIVYKIRGGDNANPVRRSKHNDGRIGWRKWAIRGQDTVDHWLFGEDGGIMGMVQTAPPRYTAVEIPIEKMLLFRTVARQGNPEGRSVLRNAYGSWYYKNNIQRIEAIGIERDMAGLPVAHMPARYLSASASAEEQALREAIKTMITNIRRDQQEGLVWPSDVDENGHELFRLELLSTGGARQFDTDAIIARYDQRIAMTLLADFILLGHENVGSFSLSADKTELFQSALTAWLDSIADVINRFAIPRLMRYNGVSAEQHPRLVFGKVRKIHIQELTEYVSAMTGANIIVPDDELEAHMRQIADLPAIPEDRGDRTQPAAQPLPQDQQSDSETAAADEAMQAAAMRIIGRGW